jgi:DNA polymerase I-like protein with 3'-5' exonuclease and polymerase domains
MKTYALDTETFYSKEYSVADMDVWHYVNDPRFDCYLMTLAGDDGSIFAGRPEEFDWSLLDGDVTIVSHNRGFDKTVIERLVELGTIPPFKPAAWWCSADCAAFHGLPRSLAGACEQLFNIKPDKTVRDRMKGREVGALNPQEGLELVHYAVEDAKLCLKLWQALSPTWPAEERELSAHTSDMGLHGVPVDIEAIDSATRKLADTIWNAEQEIPWSGESPILSAKALATECRKVGIEPPKSLAKDSEECAAWEDRFGSQYPWVGAMRDWRRSNAIKSKLETMRARIKPGTDRAVFSLKYFGGHTGRFSGGGGWNLQNLGRGEIMGVNMRSMIKAAPGYVFISADSAQIEPRVTALLAEDEDLLEAVRNGFGVYTAFARSNGLWDGPKDTLKKDNPALYQMCKAAVLGLSYGAGAPRFVQMAPTLTGGAYAPTLDEAERVVRSFREKNPKITSLWSKLERGMRSSVLRDFSVELPSRRLMTWRKVTSLGGMTALTVRGGRLVRQKYFGAKLLENVVQATARDVLAWHVRKIEECGLRVCLHVHDEVLVEVPEDQAEAALATVLEVMETPPPWAPDLPLGAEGVITPVFTK